MAMDNAERQRKYRARHRAEGLTQELVWVEKGCDPARKTKKKEDRSKAIKKNDYGHIYDKYRLSIIHRYYKGDDISLIALFSVFEILHNLKNFVDAMYNNENVRLEYIKDWYKRVIETLEEGEIDIIDIHPAIYNFIFRRPFMTKRKKNIMLKKANQECIWILEQNGLLSYIKDALGKM
jgi:hypothetical protein